MSDITKLRYRYQSSDGKPIWLAFDPDFKCVYCDQPVNFMSAGGPAVCGTCDCGRHKGGRQWDANDASKLYRHAQERFDGLPRDPIWDEYEKAYLSALPADAPTATGKDHGR